MQYLVTILIIVVIYFMFIKKKPLKNTTTKKDEKLQSNDMIECASCGTYVELDDSILSNNKYYCSQECVEKK